MRLFSGKPSGRSRGSSRRSGDSPTSTSLDTWLDVLGLMLVGLGALTLFSLISAQRTALMEGWLGAVRLTFGWGVYGAPLVLGGVGLYLLARRFGDRVPLPAPTRLLSAVAAYLCALAVLHGLAMVIQGKGGEAVRAEAAGGGALGWLILSALGSVIGLPGAGIVAFALLLATTALSLRLDLQGILAWIEARRAHRQQPSRVIILGQADEPSLHDAQASLPSSPEPELDDLVINDARSRRQARARAQADEAPPVRVLGGTAAASPEPASRSAAPTADQLPPPRPIGSASKRSPQPEPSPAPTAPSTPVDAVASRPTVQRTWVLPRVAELLELGSDAAAQEAEIRRRAAQIEETLRAFGAPGRVVEVNRGPTITQFGVEPGFVEMKGGRQVKVKVSRIAALADDLALALAAPRIRIEAPVPGRSIVGIEVPNGEKAIVALRDVMESEAFEALQRRTRLPLALGQDVTGNPVVADLTGMPHLLIAGTTGSGKSVCVNSIITTLLCLNTPDDLRFLMIDPKRVELTGYNGIPHLIAPVVVDVEKSTDVLKWATREMDSRYRLFARYGVRHITDFNARAEEEQRKPAPDPDLRKLPYIVLIIDELADLMMSAPDETEKLICRLAQMARATGIHLIIATQRPSVDVVTGLIKANFPARIAFAVATSVDSRVILDAPGAEKLLGRGDMLFVRPDQSMPVRAQGCYLRDEEISRVVRHWRSQADVPAAARPVVNPLSASAAQAELPLKSEPQRSSPSASASPPTWDEARALRDLSNSSSASQAQGKDDKLFNEAVATVRLHGKASISLLQRRLRIGYTRAARLIEEMEERGIVGPAIPGQQYREVLSPPPEDEDDGR
ncbi:MAG: DNA translocase FtsK [Anaerolineae bacterium]|nr:DNA translocase FtsK [Anaerolineae bacterium]